MQDDIDYSVYYRRWHNESDQHFDFVARHLTQWLGPQIAHLPAGARVLDYGCGFGLLTHYLRQRFAGAEGVDASAQQVEVARRRGLPVELVTVEAFAAWAEDRRARYDAVFLFDVLEHIPPAEQLRFMRLLAATLRPGGEMYIKVPNANSPLAARWRYNDWTHHASFTECSLEFVCVHAGLGNLQALVDETSTPARWPWIPRWGLRHYYVKHFVRWLWRLYLRSEIGSDERHVRLGLNLLVKAQRIDGGVER